MIRAKCFPLVLAAAILAGCATNPHQSLPVRMGTVIETQEGLRPEFQPSTGGAVAGGVLGGVAGSHIGKGNGRKLATVIGVVGGAAVGAGAGGSTKMVRFVNVTFRDNASGQIFDADLSGPWRPGMAIRYSLTEDGKLVLR